MYSGTTLTNYSGNIFGVHQKINKSARRLLDRYVNGVFFPPIKQINYFEGKNGPDGMKTKSTGRDEPWHFYDPYDPEDTPLIKTIKNHFSNLVVELKKMDVERAAFEAAWLSHAITDGLTPAHHYPYEEVSAQIRGSNKKPQTIREKMLARGQTRKESLKKNWQLWGAKGLMSTHNLFEWGVAVLVSPYRMDFGIRLNEEDFADAQRLGVEEMFARAARRIAGELAYDDFYRRGWTPKLARWVKNDLMPEITKTVALAWYLALQEAKL